jgi:hypothetical protein
MTNHAGTEKTVAELVKGDVVHNIFDRPFKVNARIKDTGHTRSSKWTGQPVAVLEVSLRLGREVRTHWWNADRKVRVNAG